MIWYVHLKMLYRKFILIACQGRNFALNPNQGLKISAFKEAHTPQAMADRELDKVSRYMVHLANTYDDFTNINHKVCEQHFLDVTMSLYEITQDWKHVVRHLPPRQ